jgi:hypothetical protein
MLDAASKVRPRSRQPAGAPHDGAAPWLADALIGPTRGGSTKTRTRSLPGMSPRRRRARGEDVHELARGMPHVTVWDENAGRPVYQVGGKVVRLLPQPSARCQGPRDRRALRRRHLRVGAVGGRQAGPPGSGRPVLSGWIDPHILYSAPGIAPRPEAFGARSRRARPARDRAPSPFSGSGERARADCPRSRARPNGTSLHVPLGGTDGRWTRIVRAVDAGRRWRGAMGTVDGVRARVPPGGSIGGYRCPTTSSCAAE